MIAAETYLQISICIVLFISITFNVFNSKPHICSPQVYLYMVALCSRGHRLLLFRKSIINSFQMQTAALPNLIHHFK